MYDTTKPYTERIKALIKRTWDTPYVKIEDARYPIIKKKHNLDEIDHSDGIGTKGLLYWKNRDFKSAVQDALAMNLNDLLLVGAKAYKLQNHLLLPYDDHNAIEEIITHMSDECVKREIAITGGETSIHDNIEGMEIAMCVSGVKKYNVKGKANEGDVLVGIESSGIHSNGLTLARRVLYDDLTKYLQPTHIYADQVLNALHCLEPHITAMMHITGGAFTKLKDCVENKDILINKTHNLEPQKIFQELYKQGVDSERMYKTFNCGVGFVIFVHPSLVFNVKSHLKPFKTDVIGKVLKGDGKNRIFIHSKFSKKSDKTVLMF